MGRIYTTYFAKAKKLPEHIVPVSIAMKPPSGWQGLQYSKLAPLFWIWAVWHNQGRDNALYTKNYEAHVLSRLNPLQVYNELMELSGGKDIALVCYEKPQDFCHRHLVGRWLIEHGVSQTVWGEIDL